MSLFPLMAMLITGVGPLSILPLNFTLALRLQIDFEKNWHWSIAKEFRTSCLDLAFLFPSGDIPIKVESHVKDLGERFHYNKAIQLGNVKEKIS